MDLYRELRRKTKRRIAVLSTLVMLISASVFLRCETMETTSTDPDEMNGNLYLWCATEEELANIYAANGRVIRTLNTPGGEPSGLAFDGSCIWNADNQTGSLYRIDVQFGIPILTIDIPGDRSSGLAWDGEYLWSIYNSLEKVDTFTGEILKSCNVSGVGLAWDGDNLWTSHNEFLFGDTNYYQCYFDQIDPVTGEITNTYLLVSEKCNYPVSFDNTNIRGLAWFNGDLWYSMTHTSFLIHDPNDPTQGGTYTYRYYIGYYNPGTETDHRLFEMDFPISGITGYIVK
ncbi:MAG: hypothetical protein GY771_09795 [bacterium]|nr:hypothetical protein [bacterium]